MAVTEKLYLEDFYLNSTTAKVIGVEGNAVFLDKTVFFAEGGGQVGDSGTLNHYKVIDTQKKIVKETTTLYHPNFPTIKINTANAHILEEAPEELKVGDIIEVKIDWDRRYNIMRYHTATHIVLWFIWQAMNQNLPIDGCYIESNKSRIDYPDLLSQEKLEEITDLTNNFIKQNFEIKKEPLVESPEALYWICEDIKLPCGGTHVKNTEEVGIVSLKRKKKGKSLDRVYISLSDMQ